MKIVFITTHLTIYGGGGKFLMDYANNFCEKGHDVTIIAQRINKNNYSLSNKIKLIEIGGPLPSNPLYWLEFSIIKRKYLREIANIESDIIISLHFPTNYFCSQTNKNIKYVQYCLEPYRFFHDKRFYSSAPLFLRVISFILRLFFKRFDIIGAQSATEIIYISKFTARRGKERYGRSGILHYIGVEVDGDISIIKDFNLRKSLMLKENTPIIFTLGLSAHLKGAKELIYIFKRILKEKPETVLLIGGRPTKTNEKILKNSIKKLKIQEKNVIFYGFIEDNLINHFYKQSTLTFYTAINESFGLIPLESMKNGTPVIAFEGGPSETVVDGKTGYIVKTDDLNDFAQKALKLLEEKPIYKQFSERGNGQVRQNFSLEKGILSLEKILINIVEN